MLRKTPAKISYQVTANFASGVALCTLYQNFDELMFAVVSTHTGTKVDSLDMVIQYIMYPVMKYSSSSLVGLELNKFMNTVLYSAYHEQD